MPLSDDQADPFDRFMSAYPERDEQHDLQAAREAWGRAIERARPETLIAAAGAYRKAREGQPARYTMGAARWLRDGRWRDFSCPNSGHETCPNSGHLGPGFLENLRWVTIRTSEGDGPMPEPRAMVWIEYGSREWDAWAAFWRETKGKTPPMDRRGGWRFPARWPPSIMHAAE